MYKLIWVLLGVVVLIVAMFGMGAITMVFSETARLVTSWVYDEGWPLIVIALGIIANWASDWFRKRPNSN